MTQFDLTHKQLKKQLSYWQKVLRLQDWQIDVRFVGTEELVSQAAGSTEVHQDGKLATIKILSSDAYNQTSQMIRAFGYDPEATLVHEMLHIHFDHLLNDDPNDHEQIMQEQAIEFLAQALVGLYRKTNKEESP